MLTYSVVSNSNPALFTNPTNLIVQNRLTLTTKADQSGTATIVVRATDKHGVSTGTEGNPDAVFTVTVEAKPVFTSLTAVSVPENTTTVQTVVATDSDLPAQTVTYSLSGGADQALFNLTTGGALTFKSAPDFENPADANDDNVYVVQVQANDGNGGTATQTINVTVTAVSDESPVFTSATAVSVAENTTAVLTVVATDDDLPAETVTYSISDGADKDLFEITSDGVLTFKTAPDFEAPADAGTNNVYAVQVTADDGNGGSTTQDINVTVTAVNDNSPTIISSPNITVALGTASVDINEGTTAVGNVLATDADLPEQTLIYSIIDGADKDLFEIASDGALSFKIAPDFENPTDENQDNIYVVEVQASDGLDRLDSLIITVTVNNANDNPVFTSPDTVNVAENTTAVQTVIATDDDLPAETVTYSISDGADKDLFEITSDGVLTFKSAPDFEAPTDDNQDNAYVVEVQADDENGGTTKQTITVNVTAANDNDPTFTSPASIDIDEGTTLVGTVLATDADLPTQTVNYSIIGGADQDLFDITADGVLSFKSAPSFSSPTDADQNNAYIVTVQASDGLGGLASLTITVNVKSTND